VTNFFDRLQQIDRIIEAGPAADSLAKLRGLMLEFTSEDYAFKKMDLSWFPHLSEENAFRKIPKLKNAQWPAGTYLARIAKQDGQRPEIAEKLKAVLSYVPETENPCVFENVVDIVLALPTDVGAKISFALQSWIGRQGRLDGRQTTLLIKHFASAGEWAAALRVFQAIFAVYPDPDFYERPEGQRLMPKPKSHFDSWQYEKHMSGILGSLSDHADARLVWVLCQLLNDAVRFSQRALDRHDPDDFSYIWRPAVESATENRHSIEGSLVSALRLATERLVAAHPGMFREVVGVLGVQQWFVFTRLVLHLLRVSEASPLDMIRDYLTDEAYSSELTLRHEYTLLLRDRFRQLQPQDQQKILDRIEKGPDVQNYVQRRQQWNDESPTEAETERFVKQWQFDWLSFIQDFLPPEWKSFYSELSQNFQPSRTEPFVVTSGPVSYSSPATSEELSAKTVPEVVAYLSTWRSDGSIADWDGPSRAGLAGTLRQVIVQNPSKYAPYADTFASLDPVYVRSLVEAFTEAVKREIAFSWGKLLELGFAVAAREDSPPALDPAIGQDPQWNWTKRSVISLLEEGFAAKDNSIPFELRMKAFSILNTLAADRGTGPQSAEELRAGTWDLVAESLNTVQGTALHAALRYALWVRSKELEFNGMRSIPEVAELLDRKLAEDEGSSLLIRAILGQWLPWLASLDEKWAAERVDRIFPDEPSLSRLWQAAWTAYIIYCEPFDKVLELLQEKYAKAVEELDKEEPVGRAHINPAERLAEHLMTFYWRGKLDLGDGGLIQRLVSIARSEVRARCLEFIGRSLGNTDVVQEPILNRLQLFFEWLLDQTRVPNSEKCPEFSAFGWWVISGKFQDEWRVKSLRAALQLAKDIDPTDKILEELEGLAAYYPKEAAECVALIASGDHEPWDFSYWSELADKVLEAALHAGGPEIRPSVEEAANLFGQAGYLKFRRFVGG
jgi:hypothetical protein